jgi:hypothetical protein
VQHQETSATNVQQAVQLEELAEQAELEEQDQQILIMEALVE